MPKPGSTIELAILAALEETRREAIEEAAKVAGERPFLAVECGYSVDSTFRIGQDIARFEARDAIRALLDAPDSKRPGTTEDAGPDAA